jgi:hypothetical protein
MRKTSVFIKKPAVIIRKFLVFQRKKGSRNPSKIILNLSKIIYDQLRGLPNLSKNIYNQLKFIPNLSKNIYNLSFLFILKFSSI